MVCFVRKRERLYMFSGFGQIGEWAVGGVDLERKIRSLFAIIYFMFALMF